MKRHASQPSLASPGGLGLFGGYVLERRIARGRCAEVFFGRPREGSLPAPELVVKRLRPELAGQPEMVERLTMEGRLQLACRHPNVVHAFDVDELDGLPFLVLEHVDTIDPGWLLRYAQARGEPVPIPLAVHIAREVLVGLSAVHEARNARGPLGIVHGEVVPRNVFLSPDGRVRLADFGSARSRLQATRRASGTRAAGAARYLAPELLAADDTVDERADLYSLAMILVEMLLGTKIFDLGGDLGVHLSRSADEAATGAGRLPRALRDVVAQALFADPGMRPRSARDLETELRPFGFASRDEARRTLREWVLLARHRAATTELHAQRGATPAPSEPPSAGAMPSVDAARKPTAKVPSASGPAEGPLPSIVVREPLLAPARPGEQSPVSVAIARIKLREDTGGDRARRAPVETRRPSRKVTVPVPTPPAEALAAMRAGGEPDEAQPPSREPGGHRALGDRITPVTPPPCHVKGPSGDAGPPLTFADVVERVVTGRVGPRHEVDLYGRGFARVADLPELARHLPAPRDRRPDLASDLRQQSALVFFARLDVHQESGLVVADGEHQARREFYVASGRLVHVTSTEAEDLLGEYLVRVGVLRPEDLARALEALPQHGGRMGHALIALGFASPRDIFNALRDRGRKRTADLFGWRVGRLSFFRGVKSPVAEFSLDLPLAEIMLAGELLASPGDAPLTRYRRMLERTVVPCDAPHLFRRAWPSAIHELLSAVGAGRPLNGVLHAMRRTPAPHVLRALDVALALGLVKLV